MTETRTSGRRIVTVAMFLGLLSIGAVVAGRRFNATSRDIDQLRADLSAQKLRASLPPVIIKEFVGDPGRETRTPPAEVSSGPPPVPPATSAPSHEERDQRLRRINEERLDLCEKRFESEAADPKWSDTAVTMLRESYSGEQFKALNILAKCRSTLCRLEFSFSDPSAGPVAVREMTSVHPWHSQRFTHFDQEENRGISYLAREGNNLPQVDLAP